MGPVFGILEMTGPTQRWRLFLKVCVCVCVRVCFKGWSGMLRLLPLLLGHPALRGVEVGVREEEFGTQRQYRRKQVQRVVVQKSGDK